MIYLVAKGRYKGVKSINLSKIEWIKFKLDLSKFNALICTSKNALKALKFNDIDINFKGTLYVAGAQTARTAAKMGFKHILIAPKENAQSLLDEFQSELKGKKALFLRGEKVALNFAFKCEQLGICCKELIAYKNLYKPLKKPLNLTHPSIFIFTSPLLASFFLRECSLEKSDKVVAIGPSTASFLKKHCKNEIHTSAEASIKECVKLARNLERV